MIETDFPLRPPLDFVDIATTREDEPAGVFAIPISPHAPAPLHLSRPMLFSLTSREKRALAFLALLLVLGLIGQRLL